MVSARQEIGHQGLIGLTEAEDALGFVRAMQRYGDEIPLVSIVGTAARRNDYDADFNPARRDERWYECRRRLRSGSPAPSIDLVRLGELYFVVDGHRRVSVAREAGITTLPARIVRVCTVAYAMCCLRAEHLPSKAAERRFLERVPLPDHIRTQLWLDRPADWARLADAARAWALDHRDSWGDRPPAAHELASAWWRQEVVPVLTALRADGVGANLRDVQLFVTALAARDRLGALDWPARMLGHPPIRCCEQTYDDGD